MTTSYEIIQEDNGWDSLKAQKVSHILSHHPRLHQREVM